MPPEMKKSPPPIAVPASPQTATHTTTEPPVPIQHITSSPPPRIVLPAHEGWGKTSFMAYADDPLLVMVGDEQGYVTLRGLGNVPDVPTAHITAWDQWETMLRYLKSVEPIKFKTLCVDALTGLERLCVKHVTDELYNGDPEKYQAYGKGTEAALTYWERQFPLLSAINARGVCIVLAAHIKVKPFANPLGENYDRYVADIHEKFWSPVNKFSDANLFGMFWTQVRSAQSKKDAEAGEKGKAIGGADRILCTQRHAAYDAKNRYGMPPQIAVPSNPAELWAGLKTYFYPKGQ